LVTEHSYTNPHFDVYLNPGTKYGHRKEGISE
jgi:hypothetical protein